MIIMEDESGKKEMKGRADRQEVPPRKLKAVLFDMDGVLFDSMPGHAVAWVEAVKRFGLCMTAEEVYLQEGQTGAGTINMLAQRAWGRDATAQEIEGIYAAKCEEFNNYFLARGEAPVMEGVTALLDKVRNHGLMRVIVTGSGQHSLLDNLNRHFPGQFARELMVTAFDVKKGKPYPEPYLMGLSKAGINADEAVVVENAPLGVEAARAAGIYTIAVNTGPLPDAVLWEAGANAVFPSMQALTEQFDAMFGY